MRNLREELSCSGMRNSEACPWRFLGSLKEQFTSSIFQQPRGK